MPIRFTKAEAHQLAAAAKKNDQTLSEWIRRTVLRCLVLPRTEIGRLTPAAAQASLDQLTTALGAVSSSVTTADRMRRRFTRISHAG